MFIYHYLQINGNLENIQYSEAKVIMECRDTVLKGDFPSDLVSAVSQYGVSKRLFLPEWQLHRR